MDTLFYYFISKMFQHRYLKNFLHEGIEQFNKKICIPINIIVKNQQCIFTKKINTFLF